jgi:hypothetical protein
MKRLLYLFAMVAGLTACEVNVVEPVYDGRDRLVGRYQIEEYSETFNDLTYYTLNIAKSSYSSREIVLYNFYALDGSIIAYLDGNKIRIPLQVINDYEISGVGTFLGNDIDLNYTVYDLQGSAQTDYCESIAIRN